MKLSINFMINNQKEKSSSKYPKHNQSSSELTHPDNLSLNIISNMTPQIIPTCELASETTLPTCEIISTTNLNYNAPSLPNCKLFLPLS